MIAAESLWASNMFPFFFHHHTLRFIFSDGGVSQHSSVLRGRALNSANLHLSHWTLKALQVAARCCEVLRGAARSSRPKGDQDQLRSACETFGFVWILDPHWGAWVPLSRAFLVLMAVLAVLMVAVQCLDLARAREPKGNPTQEESTRKEKEEEEQIPKILKKRQKKMTVVVDRSYGSDRSDQSLLSCDSVTRQKESSTCTWHVCIFHWGFLKGLNASNVQSYRFSSFLDSKRLVARVPRPTSPKFFSQGQSTKLFGFMHAQASVFGNTTHLKTAVVTECPSGFQPREAVWHVEGQDSQDGQESMSARFCSCLLVGNLETGSTKPSR